LEAVRCQPVAVWQSAASQIADSGLPLGPLKSLANRDLSVDVLTGALQRFHAVALAPYWSPITAASAADQSVRARVLIERGLDAALDELHPGVTWRNPVLRCQIDDDGCPPGCIQRVQTVPDRLEVQLDGRGLTIEPSVFAPGIGLRLPDSPDDRDPVALIYPVATDWRVVTRTTESNKGGVPALIGKTRSAILDALAEGPLTTTGLARRVHIAPASASEHASILRSARMIESVRDGNRMTHQLTALGLALARP
jgi:DNA-binding transcriptional ArsR family regulator